MSKTFSEWRVTQPEHAPETFDELVQDAIEYGWRVVWDPDNNARALSVLIPAPYELAWRHPVYRLLQEVMPSNARITIGQMVYRNDDDLV